MSARIAIGSAADLRVTPTSKRNFNTLVNGQVLGQWYGMFVQLPAGGFAGNTGYIVLGAEGASNPGGGVFNGVDNFVFRIGGDSPSQDNSGATPPIFNRMRPRLLQNGGSGITAWAPNEGDPGTGTGGTFPQFTRSPVTHFVVFGQVNIGDNTTPIWRNFYASCPVGVNSPTFYVAATAPPANFISSTNSRRLNHIFMANSTTVSTNRTPTDTVIEHVAIIDGNFPWDIPNGRPDLSIIAGLAGASGTNLTYASPSVLGTGGRIADWWKLNDTFAPFTTAGLANYGTTAASGPAVITGGANPDIVNGIVPAASISPAHWNPPVITIPTPSAPNERFIGGRGTRARTWTGTYDTSAIITTMQRRWQDAAGNALPGLDWGGTVTFSAGSWSFTDTLPSGGPYFLRMRTTDNPTSIAGSDDWLVGTTIVTHGQSGVYRAFNGVPFNTNILSITPAANAHAVFVDINNAKDGGSPGAYIQPIVQATRITPGLTPGGVGSGVVAMVNEWASHNAGPVMIVNLSLSGSMMGDWARGGTVFANGSFGGWPFQGDLPPVLPGPTAPNGAGLVGTLALAANRWADLHILMWTPGYTRTGSTGSEGGPEGDVEYFAAIDARFNGNPTAPILFLPPWRGGRLWDDSSGDGSRQSWHVTAATVTFASRGVLGPCWNDTVVDGNGSLHSAYRTVAVGDSPADVNMIGGTRACAGMGRSAAWVFNRSIKAIGPRMVKAYFQDGTRQAIVIETGRRLRTLNNAAIHNAFWVSEASGAWVQSSERAGGTFTPTISGTKVILTSTGTPFNANTRVDYCRFQPFVSWGGVPNTEIAAERLLDGMLYDFETYRGALNLPARAGNPLIGTNTLNGLTVQTRDAVGPRLVSTARQPGTRNLTLDLMASDGVTVLATQSVTVTVT
jgi:hypothetical protein